MHAIVTIPSGLASLAGCMALCLQWTAGNGDSNERTGYWLCLRGTHQLAMHADMHSQRDQLTRQHTPSEWLHRVLLVQCLGHPTVPVPQATPQQGQTRGGRRVVGGVVSGTGWFKYRDNQYVVRYDAGQDAGCRTEHEGVRSSRADYDTAQHALYECSGTSGRGHGHKVAETMNRAGTVHGVYRLEDISE